MVTIATATRMLQLNIVKNIQDYIQEKRKLDNISL